MENKQDKVIYITSVIKIQKDLIKHLDNYNEIKSIMEKTLSNQFKKYGITHAFLGGKPFYLSGKEIEKRDSFILGQSEFYSMNQIAESLLVSTKNNENKSFYTLIKSEHLPRNSHDKPDFDNEYYYVTYPIVAMLSEDATPIMQSNFNLCLKDDIQASITTMFEEILDPSIKVNSLAMTPHSILAQEAIFKIIQSEDPNVKGITRVTLSQAISIANSEVNKRSNQPINLMYKDGNRVILPCHTYENLTSIIAVIEEHLELPRLDPKNKDFYINLWLNNYININTAKRTLATMGYDACFARASFKYTVEGDISELYNDINNYESPEKELDKMSNFGYNVVKFETGDTSIDYISKNCKEMMFYIQKGKNKSIFEESEKELMTTSILVSYLNKENKIIASESFYGDLNEKTKTLILDELNKKAENSNITMNEVQDIVNHNYNNFFNTLLATKPNEGV